MFFLLVVKNGSILKQRACLKKNWYLLVNLYQMLPYFPLHVRQKKPRLPEDLPGIQAPLFKETEPFFEPTCHSPPPRSCPYRSYQKETPDADPTRKMEWHGPPLEMAENKWGNWGSFIPIYGVISYKCYNPTLQLRGPTLALQNLGLTGNLQ